MKRHMKRDSTTFLYSSVQISGVSDSYSVSKKVVGIIVQIRKPIDCNNN
jgi:hypothetical protein